MTVTAFEVGALFKIIDEATGPLRKIMAEVRALNDAIKLARDGMAGFSAATAPGIAGAITDVNLLAAAWGRVEAATLAAARAAGTSARAATSVPGVAATGSVGRGGGFRPGVGGASRYSASSGMHVSGPSIPLPGGGHARFGGPAMAGVAALGYSIYEGASMEYDVGAMKYHLGIDRKDTSRDDEIRNALEHGMVSTGKGLPDVVEASTDMARVMRDTPGFDVMKELPKFLQAAQAEALSKGTTLKAAMDSIVGLAHMNQAYKPGDMEKLFQVFAYLSTANPASLPSMEKTFSYVVPTLHAGADMDAKEIMLLSTILATSGVTSSKGGTWLRELGVRAMPGNEDTKSGHAHNENLKKLGLLDENGKPTWFVNGKPSLAKALEIAGPKAAAMPPEERLPFEMDLFGRRGGGAFALLGNDIAIQREKDLRAGMESPGNIARYNTFTEDQMGTTKGTAMSTLQQFNVDMIELGTKALPIASAALRIFSGALGFINKFNHPAPEGQESGWGAIPRAYNYFFPKGQPQNQSFTGDHPVAQPMGFLTGPPSQSNKPQQITLRLDVNGRTLAQAVSEELSDLMLFPTGAPAANGLAHWEDGHSQRVST
jgi:hypothetical protein